MPNYDCDSVTELRDAKEAEIEALSRNLFGG